MKALAEFVAAVVLVVAAGLWFFGRYAGRFRA